MKRVIWSKLDCEQRKAALERPGSRSDPKLLEAVQRIVEDVRIRGWAALQHYSKWIDGAEPTLIEVAPLAAKARRELDPAFFDALNLARANIERFHAAAKPRNLLVEPLPGLKIRKAWRPLERVGIYIPGGSASLFSSLLMLAIPARVAGVASVSLVTPPTPEGLNPAIAVAAELCGIEEIWAIGGAHAIAALAFGAGRIEAVDLIAGPGNAWVAAAKALVASHPGGPRIDLPAGPSELMVIADDKADARLVAADLLSQAEHDRSAQVMLVTTSEKLANRVEDEIERQLATLPRAATARAALDYARVIIVNDPRDSAKIANLYAPEHLSLAIAEPEALVPMITNAGAIFAGSYAAESFGDYAAGSSHVLPTDGAARAWSGVSTETFMKAVSVQEVSASAANELASACAILARAEGLEAHARAAELRLAGAA